MLENIKEKTILTLEVKEKNLPRKKCQTLESNGGIIYQMMKD